MPLEHKVYAQTKTVSYAANVPFYCTIVDNEGSSIPMAYAPVNGSYSELAARPLNNLSISSNSLIDVTLEVVSQTGHDIQRTDMLLLINDAFSRLYQDNTLQFQAPSPRVPYTVSNTGTPFSTWLISRVGLEQSDYEFVVRVTCLQATAE